MASTKLPSRAKPSLLHRVCKDEKGGLNFTTSEVVNSIDENDRTIRATIDYGIQIGFLQPNDDDTVTLAPRGAGISYSESFESSAVISAFREAIEEFSVYRNALLKAQRDELIREIKGDRCLTQDDLRQAISSVEGIEPADREVNLFIKTAEAAGLGEFVMGRRGLDTRLTLSDDFDEYVQELSNKYSLPETQSEDAPEQAAEDESTEPTGVPVDLIRKSGGNLKLYLELDIEEKTEEEILEMIRLARN